MLVETMGTEAELEESRQKMDEGGGMSITKQDLFWGAFEAYEVFKEKKVKRTLKYFGHFSKKLVNIKIAPQNFLGFLLIVKCRIYVFLQYATGLRITTK